MRKYKITRMNVGFGEHQYTLNWWDGIDLVPVTPIRYYKTKKTATRALKKLKLRDLANRRPGEY